MPAPIQEDTVTLRDYIETKLCALRDHIDTRLEEIEKATEIARSSMEHRLNEMNEIRGSLRDTVANQVNRDRCDTRMNVVDAELEELKKYRNTMEGKASQSSLNTVILMTVISLLMSAVSIALKLIGVA